MVALPHYCRGVDVAATINYVYFLTKSTLKDERTVRHTLDPSVVKEKGDEPGACAPPGTEVCPLGSVNDHSAHGADELPPE